MPLPTRKNSRAGDMIWKRTTGICETMKALLSKATLGASFFVLLTGCEGIPGVPYRSDTAAGRLYESHTGGGDVTNKISEGVTVPVEAGDAGARRLLEFSNVRVRMDEKEGVRSIRVFTEVSPRPVVWRVGLIKDGREIFHFVTSNRSDYLSQVIPLEPLALDPSLPVPDKIVVTVIERPLE
jgi:hypothetical protein